MRKIEYVVSDERLITPSGLALVGQVLGKSNLIKKANRMRMEKALPQIPVNPLDYPTRICYNKTNSISKAVTLHDFSEYSEVLSRAT